MRARLASIDIGPGKSFEFKDLSLEQKAAVLLAMKEADDKVDEYLATGVQTMYDGKSQLLIKNPIDRYLINSPMLPQMKKNVNGPLTLYIQKDSPGADKEADWLPAPNDTIYLVMRLYSPKTQPASILPPGEGSCKPPGIVTAK